MWLCIDYVMLCGSDSVIVYVTAYVTLCLYNVMASTSAIMVTLRWMARMQSRGPTGCGSCTSCSSLIQHCLLGLLTALGQPILDFGQKECSWKNRKQDFRVIMPLPQGGTHSLSEHVLWLR